MKTILCIVIWSGLLLSQSLQAKEVNNYLHNQPFLIEPFLGAFTEETGIKTKVLYSKKGMAQCLKNEGRKSLADVVPTIDIARLITYKSMGLIAQTASETLNNNIPAHLSSTDDTRFALSKRSRIIATSKDRVAKGELTHIEDLADPEWKARVCPRPGSHVYICAVMASMITHQETEIAEEWAKGLVANLARKPQGNDRAQVKTIFEGVCDVALINSYYYGKMKIPKSGIKRNGLPL